MAELTDKIEEDGEKIYQLICQIRNSPPGSSQEQIRLLEEYSKNFKNTYRIYFNVGFYEEKFYRKTETFK